jgi:hypothetical protein
VATTTRTILRRRLSEEIGDYQSLTTTDAGHPTYLIDTGLDSLTGDDDAFQDFYVFLTSGGAINEIQRVKRVGGYVASATKLLVQKAFSTTVASGVTYELHRYDPVLKHAAINRAIEDLSGFLYLPVNDDWSIIVDNRLTDPSFEGTLSGGAFPAWTNNVGSGSVAAETNRVFQGAQSAKITASGSTAQIFAAPYVNMNEVIGETATFGLRVWASSPNMARLRIDWDGSNFANSKYHSGNEQWELLEAKGAVPSTTTQIKCIAEVADSGTKIGYFDAGGDCGLFIDDLYEYTLPTTLVSAPSHIQMQANRDTADGLFVPLRAPYVPIRGRHLLIQGRGNLTAPTTEAETVELGVPQIRLIVLQAAMNLYEMYGSPAQAAVGDREGLLRAGQRAEDKLEKLKRQNGVNQPKKGAMGREGVWGTNELGTSRKLVLKVHG